MATYLKAMAVMVGLFGLFWGTVFGYVAVTNKEYALKKMARERNPGNVLFEGEFRMVEAQHWFVVYSSTGSFLLAFVGGSLLWGVGALHQRLDRMP